MIDFVELLRTKLQQINPEDANWLGESTFDTTDYPDWMPPYKVRLLSFTVENVDPITRPTIIASTSYSNETDIDTKETYTDLTTKIYTHSVANTEGWKFDLAEQITFHAEASFIFGFGGSSTTTFTFEYSSIELIHRPTLTQVISWTAEIPVPKRKRVEAIVTLMEAVYNPHFEAVIEVSGTVQFVDRKDGKLRIFRTTPGGPFRCQTRSKSNGSIPWSPISQPVYGNFRLLLRLVASILASLV